MVIQTTIDGNKLFIKVEGKITAGSTADLEDAIRKAPTSVCDFDIDLTDVDYVSSAGLRVFVAADQFATERGGTLCLLHPDVSVMQVLEMTGLIDMLTIEP